MYSNENMQHLGERHEALSNLTWYETLLIARVHPVISVVTLTATGLLAFAGHVCNYFQKSFEWFQELPARVGNHRFFQIKRRKSINATTGETQHKKPTTANRIRLEAAFATVLESMPNVYKTSYVAPELVAKFPEVGEQDFQAPIEPEPELGGRGQGRLADVLRVARTQRRWSDASDSAPVPMRRCSYVRRSEPAGTRHARWRDCRHSLGTLLQDLV